MHVFLAYPSSRLESQFERGLIATAYSTAIGLQPVGMASHQSDRFLLAVQQQGSLHDVRHGRAWPPRPAADALLAQTYGKPMQPTEEKSRSVLIVPEAPPRDVPARELPDNVVRL